jgi:spermidine synthase
LYLAVFLGGCTTLFLEVTAAHLLRAVYGTSNLVWATVIGLMLLFLAVGYRLGGVLADRHPQEVFFFRLLAWAGFAAGCSMALARLLIRPAASAMAALQIGPVVGSFVVAMALLAGPVVLLGCISPMALRLALGSSPQTAGAGQAAGTVYSASTLGSLLGTFIPPLLLLPTLGARATFWLLAATLLPVAALVLRRNCNPVVVIPAAGLVSLGMEVSTNRLLGPAFGDSNLVWAAVIAVNMAALAAGYAIGGRLSDWVPEVKAFAVLVLTAALTAALVPLLSTPALAVADALAAAAPGSSAILVVAVTLAALLMIGLPLTLLGAVSPFAIRLLLPRASQAGRTAGNLYAISTVGSLLGAYLPVLWLIPSWGTSSSMLVMGAILAAVAAVYLVTLKGAAAWHWGVLPLVLLFLVPVSQLPLKVTPGQVFETESAYNYIQVVERNGTYYLLLNEGQGIHSVYQPGANLTHGTWDFFLAAPFFNAPPHRPSDVNSLALIGLAAGTISKQYSAAFGPIAINGIEIDPTIVAVGQAYFDMNEPNLHVIVADGRYALRRSDQRYDVVGIDAYRLPYIPWHLTTLEFFREVADHLTDRGVVTVNVGRTPADRRLVEAMTATLQAVFPAVHVLDVPGTFNTILVATVQPTSAGNLQQNLQLMEPSFLRDALAAAHDAMRPTVAAGTVFTDDLAPIELITNRIVIEFLLSGGTREIGGPID